MTSKFESEEGFVSLLSAEYDPKIDGDLKTFRISDGKIAEFRDTLRRNRRRAAEVVAFRFKGNWGNKEYTCVTRVRVHGQEE